MRRTITAAAAAVALTAAVTGCGGGENPATPAATATVTATATATVTAAPAACLNAVDQADAALTQAGEGFSVLAEVIDAAQGAVVAAGRGDVTELRRLTAVIADANQRFDVAGLSATVDVYRASALECRAAGSAT